MCKKKKLRTQSNSTQCLLNYSYHYFHGRQFEGGEKLSVLYKDELNPDSILSSEDYIKYYRLSIIQEN